MPNYSGVWSLPAVYQAVAQGNWPIPPLTGDVGIFALGNAGTSSNTINYVNIASTGNASDFGDLTLARYYMSSGSSSTRGLFLGGFTGSGSNVIDYITISSVGNASDFGDMSSDWYTAAGFSDSTRALVAGGSNTSFTNAITYVTIATLGNSTSFGTLSTSGRNSPAGCASTTRGVIAGGFIFSGFAIRYNVMDYVTIATTGNATDFGDLLFYENLAAGLSSNTRGIFVGGEGNNVDPTNPSSQLNVIQYITIATTGNATDFGDLITTGSYMSATSSSTRGLAAANSPASNVIQYITIASLGNATDFGDLTAAAFGGAGLSNCHGGL